MATRRQKRHRHRRTRKQKGGGKLSLLPFEATPAPGERYDDKKLGSMLYDMLNNWDYFMVAAHGHSKPSSYKKVPTGTYIIFNAPAGCGANGPMIPYTEYLVNDNKARFVVFLQRLHQQAIGRLHAVKKGEAIPGGDEDFLLRTLEASERARLGSCAYPADFFAPNFKRNTRALCTVDPTFIGKTIYGPGESYPNTMVLFKNDPRYTVWLGTYELPVPVGLYEAKRDKAIELRKAQEERIEAGATNFEKSVPYFEAVDRVLYKIPENLTKDLIGQYVSLESVLDHLPALPAGKSRFVFVTVCRNVAPARGKNYSNAEALRIGGLMRAASVATENAEIEALQKATTEAAGAYYAEPVAAAAAAAVATGAATGAAEGGSGTA